METLDERVAFLEGRVGEHGHMLQGIREAIVSLEARVDRRFEGIDRRFEQIDRRFDALDAKMGRQFQWLVGLHVTTLVALVAALSGVMAAVLGR